MKSPQVLKILTTLLCALLLAVGIARAEEIGSVYVEALTPRRAGPRIVVDFDVANLYDLRLAETLDSGLPVRIVYHVRLMRRGSFFISGVVADTRIERVLEKDNLANKYRLTTDKEIEETGDLPAAIEILRRARSVDLVEAADLIPDSRYQVEVQVKLEEFRLPFHLQRLLPFLSGNDRKTPWKKMRLPNELFEKP